ncbi:sodium:solute symporter [Natronorubrum daqingense]|uniref:Sodium:solute symporter n=1 Tax=Natronorubrum daqingense TaxID=588898 RepID=A0A1N7EA49_9EURY|nr:sodium:solute symporter [Natronorubrum daqingense]APX96447.1 sodium:solute symporter [Natronorubrum daqingense]SIR84930.1 solute:Na+ symporter, SSS family [Natronorubrum daqingense]
MTELLIDGSIVALYFAAMVGVGYWGYRQSESLDDYFVAGRNIPLWMYIPVMSAVILGGASTVGGGGLGYEHGVSGAWLTIWLGVGVAVIGVLISTDLANLEAYTIGDILERRFDKYSGTVGAAIAGVYALTIAITQIISIATALTALFAIDMTTTIITAGVIVVVYTALGGMLSVTITDFVQWFIMTIGIFLLALPLGLVEVGGVSGLSAELEPSYFSPTGIGVSTVVSYFLLYCLGIMIGQDIWQRVFTADSPETARIGNIATGAYAIFYGIATAVLGMIALLLFPGLDNPDLALPMMVLEVIPVGLSGLILAGFISAMMSTADSALLASSTLFTNDVYKRFVDDDASDEKYTLISRLLILVLGAGATATAVWIGDVVNALTLAYNLLVGSIFVPIFGAFFWKGATWQGAISSIVVSNVAVVGSMALYGFGSDLPIVTGLGVSLVCFVVVSFLTGPPSGREDTEWMDTEATDHFD